MKLESRLRKLEHSNPKPKDENISISPDILREVLLVGAEWVRNNNYPGIPYAWFLLSDKEREIIPVAMSTHNWRELSIQQVNAVGEIMRKHWRFLDKKRIIESDIIKFSTPSTFHDPYSIKVDFVRNGENKTIIANRGDIIFSWFYRYYINNLLEPHPKVLKCFERYCGSKCMIDEKENRKYITNGVENLDHYDTGEIDTFEIRRMQIIESPNN